MNTCYTSLSILTASAPAVRVSLPISSTVSATRLIEWALPTRAMFSMTETAMAVVLRAATMVVLAVFQVSPMIMSVLLYIVVSVIAFIAEGLWCSYRWVWKVMN